MADNNKNSDMSTQCQNPEQCVEPNLSVWGNADENLLFQATIVNSWRSWGS